MKRAPLDAITPEFRAFVVEKTLGLVAWNPDRWGHADDLAVKHYALHGADDVRAEWHLVGHASNVGNALALLEDAGLDQATLDAMTFEWFAA